MAERALISRKLSVNFVSLSTTRPLAFARFLLCSISIDMSQSPSAEAPPELSGTGWKSGEQLEFLLSHETEYKRLQTEKRLDHFWPRVLEEWYHRWKLPPPSPDMVEKCRTPDDALAKMRKKKTKVRDS